MSLGTGPDYYTGVDHEAEKQQKLMDKVWDWWDGLTDEEQFDILLDWYPMEITKDTDIDKFFGDMSSEKQLEIYEDNN